MDFLNFGNKKLDINVSSSQLEEAHKYKDEATNAYKAQEYQKAIRAYHQCLLIAKAVAQMTSSALQEMAREEMRPADEEDEEDEKRTGKKVQKIGQTEEQQQHLVKIADEQQQKDLEQDQNEPSGSGRTRLDSSSRGQEIYREAKDLISKCYNNLAACILAVDFRAKGDYLRAVSYCDNVLKDEPQNEKALFRKGAALMKAQNWEKAVEQFEQCKNNARAKYHLQECHRQIENDRRRRDAEIRANFAKARAAEEAQAAAVQQYQQANGGAHPYHLPPPAAADNNNPPLPAAAMNGHVVQKNN